MPRAAVRSANLRTDTEGSFVTTATTSSTGALATLFLQEHLVVSPVVAALLLVRSRRRCSPGRGWTWSGRCWVAAVMALILGPHCPGRQGRGSGASDPRHQ